MSAFAIQPPTFVLPGEYNKFIQAFYRKQEKCKERNTQAQAPVARNLWILKPAVMSRGRGISLVSNLSHVRYSESAVVQTYLDKPLLLDGHKFDLRLYVLVTSFQPLEAFLYSEGFARISTIPYAINGDGTDQSLKNLRMHLTNSSVQQAVLSGADRGKWSESKASANSLYSSSGFETCRPLLSAPTSEVGGSKITTTHLWSRLQKDGLDVAHIRCSIDRLIIKSLVCVDDLIEHQPNCFELYGYDIIMEHMFLAKAAAKTSRSQFQYRVDVLFLKQLRSNCV